MPQLDEIAIHMARAFNTKDATGLSSLYDSTAILMPPGESAVQGRAAIEEWFRRACVRLGTIRILPTETRVVDDAAFQVGTFAIAVA